MSPTSPPPHLAPSFNEHTGICRSRSFFPPVQLLPSHASMCLCWFKTASPFSLPSSPLLPPYPPPLYPTHSFCMRVPIPRVSCSVGAALGTTQRLAGLGCWKASWACLTVCGASPSPYPQPCGSACTTSCPPAAVLSSGYPPPWLARTCPMGACETVCGPRGLWLVCDVRTLPTTHPPAFPLLVVSGNRPCWALVPGAVATLMHTVVMCGVFFSCGFVC